MNRKDSYQEIEGEMRVGVYCGENDTWTMLLANQ